MRTTGVRTKKNLTKQQTNKDQELYLLYLFLDRRSALAAGRENERGEFVEMSR
jgi:hypothetical protein